jgi:hypothetical protein
MDLVKL